MQISVSQGRWALLVALMLCIGSVHAAVVRQMAFPDMVDQAELIFEGRVLSHQTEWDPSGKLIVTHVNFEVTDVLKGGPYANVRLTFIGGTIGRRTLSVSGVAMPQVGEQGVYFVESTHRLQASPILGLNQGRFRNVNGRLHTSNGQPVVGFSEPRATQDLQPAFPSGLTIARSGSGQAMRLATFKNEVINLLRPARREVAQ